MSQSNSKMQKVPDHVLQVPGGTLLYHPNRDSRLPYLYVVETHPLVDRSQCSETSQGRILVYIQDVSRDVMTAQASFEETLEVPLGPDELMDALGTSLHKYNQPIPLSYMILLGLFGLLNDDIILARVLENGILASPEKDIVQAWVCDGFVISIFNSNLG